MITREELSSSLREQIDDKADSYLVGEYINIVKYSQINNISIDDALILLEGEKIFFPNGTYEVNSLNSVNNLKGESEINTIIRINSGDIQTTAFTVF